jgi:hypothetical protein
VYIFLAFGLLFFLPKKYTLTGKKDDDILNDDAFNKIVDALAGG